MRKIATVIFLFTLYRPLNAQSAYDLLLKGIYKNTVDFVYTNELQKELTYSNLILFDTRTATEYKVSHIAGAKFIDYDTFTPDLLKNIGNDAEIVVYCSVGYRSERIGEKLKALGFSKVRNLYGGIFMWKNDGHEVVNEAGHSTDSIHAYNRIWGIWLQNGEKVYDQ